MKIITKFLFVLLLFLSFVLSWDLGSIFFTQLWFSKALLITPHTPQKENELKPILQQKFTFLTKGSTCNVYLSDDGQYILKSFIEKPQFSKSPWKKAIPFLTKLSSCRRALKIKKEKISGFLNAYSLLPKETGLIYIHFAPTKDLQTAIILIDENGQRKEIDLDSAEFCLQKRALVTFDYLDRCVANGEIDKAKKAIQTLLYFTLKLYQQGIVMVDLQFSSNFGFIDDLPVRIDVEHLKFDPSWKKKYSSHLKSQLADFRSHLEKNHLELLEFFDSLTIETSAQAILTASFLSFALESDFFSSLITCLL